MHNFIESPICMGKERIRDEQGKNLHPTQKPLSVLKKIISIASNPNDIVLDCFNGVGSTGEAALSLGRKYIGVEIEPEYYRATQKRLSRFTKAVHSLSVSTDLSHTDRREMLPLSATN